MKNQSITREELKARLDSGQPVTIIEALPRRYYDAEHLPGAINIPHDEIRAQAAIQLPDKDATIVVYCANSACQNSRIAALALIAAGYRKVFEYVEGKLDWKEAGYPLEEAGR
jgi:rhodanese-related sulfurtransferase